MTILMVDGHEILRQKLIRYLELENNFEIIYEANTVKTARAILQQEKIDVLVLDIQLPDNSGLDLVNFSQKLFYKPIIILCSNYVFPQYLNIYDNYSVNYFFDKFSELHEMKALIKKIVNECKSSGSVIINKDKN